MTETLRVLREARDLIARGWTQGTLARDGNGDPVEPTSDAATCWCSLGAAKAVTKQDLSYGLAWSALLAALPESHRGYISNWNDARGRTQGQVIALFDRAIEAEEARS